MKHIVSSCIFLVIVLSLSMFVFDPTNLYYELPWLDIPMHILGGIGVSALLISIASYKHKTVTLFDLGLFYLIVAIGWELWEIIKDTAQSNSWNGWFDTIKDLIDGFIGTLGAYYFFKNK